MPISVLDIILIIPIAWFTYKGFSKGLIIELATLLGLLLGIYIAGNFSFYTADFLRDKFDFHSQYMNIISFTITFIGVVIMVMLFGKSLEKVVNLLMLSFINKLAGALFGLLKVSFILSVLIFILTTFGVEESLVDEDMQQKSHLYEPVKSIAPFVFPMVKDNGVDIFDQIDEKINDIEIPIFDK
ncbi:MAG: CvpA family protein [Bacteroidales bacterium]|nr:CvpA family protein [Bacteroidales bacterium]